MKERRKITNLQAPSLKTKKNEKSSDSIIIYDNGGGQPKIEVRFESETLWLTQKKMAELFECSVDNISLHLRNIFFEVELDEKSVIEKSSATAADGKKYKTKFYNLDAIIAVGYRVNSKKATQFRIWATRILREFIIYNGSPVKTQDFDKLCLLLSCLSICNTSINFRWSFVF